MSTTRRLTLKKETLSALTTDELRGVAAGQLLSGATCPLQACVKSDYNCLSRDQTCIDTWCPCTPAGVPAG